MIKKGLKSLAPSSLMTDRNECRGNESPHLLHSRWGDLSMLQGQRGPPSEDVEGSSKQHRGYAVRGEGVSQGNRDAGLSRDGVSRSHGSG